MTGGFGSILLKNPDFQQPENSQDFFGRLVRVSQINCAVLSYARADFHAVHTTPSYPEYGMPLKSQMNSTLFSEQSFSTE